MESLLKELAVELYNIQAVKFGDFKTENDLRTPEHFNLGVIVSNLELTLKLAKGIWALMDNPLKVSQICGFYYISEPLTYLQDKSKKNATENPSESADSSDKICVIIEEVMASGNTILELVECMTNGTEYRTSDIEVYVVFDKEQGGKKNLENCGVKVKSLFEITQFMKYLLEVGKITPEIVKNVDDYLAMNQISRTFTQDTPDNQFKLHLINKQD